MTLLETLPPKPQWLGIGIHVAYRSRKDRRCGSCGEEIPKGSMYVRHALPPSSELGNRHWMVIHSCGWSTGECRRYWEIDAKDLAGELHVIPVG